MLVARCWMGIRGVRRVGKPNVGADYLLRAGDPPSFVGTFEVANAAFHEIDPPQSVKKQQQGGREAEPQEGEAEKSEGIHKLTALAVFVEPVAPGQLVHFRPKSAGIPGNWNRWRRLCRVPVGMRESKRIGPTLVASMPGRR